MNITNLGKIELGTSKTNTKEYILKTDLKLTNNFRTYPFGSNRMRYQYPEMFKYELIKLDNNLYKLIVSRYDKPNCSVTSKFFWSVGWSLNLKVSNIPKLEQFYPPYRLLPMVKPVGFRSGSPDTQDNILQYLPKDYGEVIVDVPNIFKPKIGIIIPFFGRYEYVKQFLDSLATTNIENTVLVLIDESLTKDVNEDKKETNKLIKDYKLNFPTIKIFKNKHGNMFDSFLTGCDLLEPFCDFLMNLDSDTIHKKDWLNKIINTYLELEKEYPNKPILLSGFNTVNGNRHNILKEYENYSLKTSVGGCHLCFRKELYNNLLRYVVISNKWDTNIHNIINKNNGIIAVTKPSVIDHIGEISSGHRNSKNEIYDKSIDF